MDHFTAHCDCLIFENICMTRLLHEADWMQARCGDSALILSS